MRNTKKTTGFCANKEEWESNQKERKFARRREIEFLLLVSCWAHHLITAPL
jgi:hypothetical protein